jgi:hypothetical protein
MPPHGEGAATQDCVGEETDEGANLRISAPVRRSAILALGLQTVWEDIHEMGSAQVDNGQRA